MASNLTSFAGGDLVVSVYGDGDGSGNYTDNQASPVTLEELTTSGTVVGQLVLPQTASTNPAGVTENAFSGEYGSSSEGTLELSADGQSLTIAGYGVNAQTYNSGGATTYGNAALAQSTSVPGGKFVAIPRAIADIRFDGTVDTSTAVYNVDNTNNPRSVATTDGSSFYLAGQGVKGDATQGLFYVKDGASSGTAINNATDMRTAELYNGNLYVSTDSKQGPTSNIAEYSGEPTTTATPTRAARHQPNCLARRRPGQFDQQLDWHRGAEPENFYFANSSTLYVADGGQPKQGGVGDGGLQKYSLVNGTWKLDYTLSSGLSLVNGTTAKAGTTGLIGLTGTTSGDTVSLYATNSTIGDLDPTYLYGIQDQLSATSLPADESFTTLMTAAPDTNIRGVAFAPQAAAVCFAQGTRIATTRGDLSVEELAVGDLVVTSSGEHRPIRWLGHRNIDCRRHLCREHVLPVRISAHAFGENLPARQLYLSPGHPVLVGADADGEGGHLVPIMCLINGTTIKRVAVNEVTYWHVELDQHDILLAEGLPAESYIDLGSRPWFVGADGALYDPDMALPGMPGRCRPVAVDGAVVEAERRRLDRVFAMRLAGACSWPDEVSLTFD